MASLRVFVYIYVCFVCCVCGTETNLQDDSASSSVSSSIETSSSSIFIEARVAASFNASEAMNKQSSQSSSTSDSVLKVTPSTLNEDSIMFTSSMGASFTSNTLEGIPAINATERVILSSTDKMSSPFQSVPSTNSTLASSVSTVNQSLSASILPSTSLDAGTSIHSGFLTTSSVRLSTSTTNIEASSLLSSSISFNVSSPISSLIEIVTPSTSNIISETTISGTFVNTTVRGNTSTPPTSHTLKISVLQTSLFVISENSTLVTALPRLRTASSFAEIASHSSLSFVTESSVSDIEASSSLTETMPLSGSIDVLQTSFDSSSLGAAVTVNTINSSMSSSPVLTPTAASSNGIGPTSDEIDKHSMISADEDSGSTYIIVTSESSTAVMETSTDDSSQPETSSLAMTPDNVNPTLHSTYTDVTSSYTIHVTGKTYRVLLTFEGSCGRIEDSDQLKIEFMKALVDIIRGFIPELTDDDFELTQLICDPFKIVLLINNIRDSDCLSMLTLSVRNLTMNVPVIDNTVINYHATGIQLVPVSNDTSDGMGKPANRGLATSDVVVIVISVLLFAFLFLLGGIVFCRECYKRKRAASFNLVDVPHVNLKLDDFTLTRIPRPKMTYFDNRANQVVTNGRHRQPPTTKVSPDSQRGEEQKVNASPENIHVRMRDHTDGIIIGITCSPIASEANSPTSSHGPCMDQSEQTLLKGHHSGGGTANPTCNVDDEQNFSLILEDEKEEFL